MQRVRGSVTRGVLFVLLLVGAFVVKARANAILCEECYGATGPTWCEDKENGRIKNGTCKAKSGYCTGLACGSEDEGMGEDNEWEGL